MLYIILGLALLSIPLSLSHTQPLDDFIMFLNMIGEVIFYVVIILSAVFVPVSILLSMRDMKRNG